MGRDVTGHCLGCSLSGHYQADRRPHADIKGSPVFGLAQVSVCFDRRGIIGDGMLRPIPDSRGGRGNPQVGKCAQVQPMASLMM